MLEAKHIIAAGATPQLAVQLVQPILDACQVYGINTKQRMAAFLAQLGHESASFTRTVENLNYSAQALQKTFARYFPTEELAQQYARQPEKIANRVYGGRLGNGPEETGEGWKYRGRGFIQLTGKSNVLAFSQHYHSDDRLVTDPTPLELYPLAAMSAGWYWNSRQLNALADADQFTEITKKINGGTHGLEDRQNRWQTTKQVFGIITLGAE